MRNIVSNLFILYSFIVSISANALMLTVEPNLTALKTGDTLTVDLNISGLGDGSALSLSTFDIDLEYDPTVLNFTGLDYSEQLDLFGFGSFRVTDSSIPGMINLFELSFDSPSDLDLLQLPSFSLATLTFSTENTGGTSLLLSINALGDALGDALVAEIHNSSIQVSSNTSIISEPPTLFFIALGLIGLSIMRRRC